MAYFMHVLILLFVSYILVLIKFYSIPIQNLEQELKNSLLIKWNTILIAIRVIKLYTITFFQK